MATQLKLPLGLSSTDKINHWADRYTQDQTGAQKLVEQYLIGLKNTVWERKTPEAPRGYLLYGEFYDLFYWKLERKPRSLTKQSKYEIQEITGEAFRLDNDREKLNTLTEVHDVGQSVASAILHLCDQKEYPILDQHALRSIDIEEEYADGPEYPFWQEYVDLCRAEAKRYNVSMRTLDQALWKYSEVGMWENDDLRCQKYPRTNGPIGVTMPNGEQIRRQYGVDTYIETIEKIGIDKVYSLKLKYGQFPLIYDPSMLFEDFPSNADGRWKTSGFYYIKVPGPTDKNAAILREIARQLNINLKVDVFQTSREPKRQVKNFWIT